MGLYLDFIIYSSYIRPSTVGVDLYFTVFALINSLSWVIFSVSKTDIMYKASRADMTLPEDYEISEVSPSYQLECRRTSNVRLSVHSLFYILGRFVGTCGKAGI